MNRRGFLAAAVSAALAPKALIQPGVQVFETVAMAPAIAGDFEISSLRYAATERYSNALIAPSVFRDQLLDGLNEVFRKAHAEHEPGEWEKLFAIEADQEPPTEWAKLST
jgi:hypothetical protein